MWASDTGVDALAGRQMTPYDRRHDPVYAPRMLSPSF